MIRVKNLSLGLQADPPGKPALLLVHGLLSSRHHWTPNLDALRRGYRLVIAELPGHGRAPACTEAARLHPDALADELDRARQILGIARWHICGQSFGAGLTLRLALRHPGAVGAQVWTNGNRVLAPDLDAAGLAQDAARAAALLAEGVAALRRESFHPRFGLRFPPDLRETLAADADACDLPSIAALMRHTLGPLPMRGVFGATAVPTLLVNGLTERRFQPVRDMAQGLLPGMEIADLKGGHAINIECPEPFNAAVLAFLARHDGRLAAAP